jgi:hypothetical protein
MKETLLNVLNEDQINELIKRYYLKEKVSDLIKEYQLNIKPAQLVGLFPLKKLEDSNCSFCKTPMSQQYAARTTASYSKLPTPLCETCGHKDYDPNDFMLHDACECNNCIRIRRKVFEAQLNRHNEQILNIQHKAKNETPFTEFSLRQVLFLLSLCRAGQTENTDTIYFGEHQLLQVSPTKVMDSEIYELTYNEKMIDISSSTLLGEIHFQNKKPEYKFKRVTWRLNFSNDEEVNIQKLLELEAMLRNRELWPSTWVEELPNIWNELALHECLAYLEQQLEIHNFEFRAGKKTIQVIKQALDNYSILKCYYFIWAAVRSAASYYLRADVSRLQASNTVVGGIQRRVERAIAEGWEIKEFSKNSQSGTSALTALFSNVATKLNNSFFTEIPSSKRLL